ncbi:MAG: hypothetical protein Kow00107_01200 [Planctomycetota bacterium]
MARTPSSRKRRTVSMGLPIKITAVGVVSAVIVSVVLMFAFGGKNINWKLVGPLVPLLVVMAGIVSYIFSLTITKPLASIVNDVTRLADGDYSVRTRISGNDEIGVLADSVNELAESLSFADKSMKVVSKIEDDINLAAETQSLLLPQIVPKIPTLDIYPWYEAATALGGDYYDFIPLSPEHLWIVIADVSGKGITGSMIMGIFRSILRRFAEESMSTMEVLVKTNELLSRDLKRGMFVTVYYLIYHIPTNEITFSCAGHTPMVIYRKTSKTIELVKPTGMAVGFDTGLVFNRSIQEHKLRLRSGDRLVLYTDGVVEAMNRRGDKFGENRFYKFVKECAELTSKEFLLEFQKDLEDFRRGAEKSDDITLVTLKVN